MVTLDVVPGCLMRSVAFVGQAGVNKLLHGRFVSWVRNLGQSDVLLELAILGHQFGLHHHAESILLQGLTLRLVITALQLVNELLINVGLSQTFGAVFLEFLFLLISQSMSKQNAGSENQQSLHLDTCAALLCGIGLREFIRTL